MSDTIDARSVSLEGAQRVLAAALAEAGQLGLAICVTVSDPSGLPVLTARMDGAPRLSARIATDKAFSVASFGGAPTHGWWDAIKNEPALVHGITKTPRLTIFGGGLPLRAGGELIGAIGVSGGTVVQDQQVAQAGADALA